LQQKFDIMPLTPHPPEMYSATVSPPLDVERHSLLLDFDGTLVDFAPLPDAIKLRPGTVDLLRRLTERFRGAVALVTGRHIENVDHFLDPLKLPAIGVHGQEVRRHGEPIAARVWSPEIDIARGRIAASLREHDPLLFEDKGSALVLHFRICPKEGVRALAIAQRAVDGLEQLEMVEGHAIAEVRERKVSKADAISIVAAWPEFAGRKPVLIGDDTTDEDGFRAAAGAGGFGVKVGPGDTAAQYRLAGVDAVHEWLAIPAGRQELAALAER